MEYLIVFHSTNNTQEKRICCIYSKEHRDTPVKSVISEHNEIHAVCTNERQLNTTENLLNVESRLPIQSIMKLFYN